MQVNEEEELFRRIISKEVTWSVRMELRIVVERKYFQKVEKRAVFEGRFVEEITTIRDSRDVTTRI